MGPRLLFTRIGVGPPLTFVVGGAGALVVGTRCHSSVVVWALVRRSRILAQGPH
jgi:hypothetical protein